MQIEISSVVEECQKCGASLADTLRIQRATTVPRASIPKIQTAYDLMKFRFDIAKIDSFFHLGSAGLLCIVGYKANLVLTKLCVRALLPAKYGGLDSSYVLVIDAGNKSDLYQTVNFARQYGMNFRDVLNRIIVSRTFTIHQLKNLLSQELPKVISKYQAGIVVIPGLLDLFDDPNIKQKEAKRVIFRIMKSLNDTSNRILVVTSVQESKYSRHIIQNNTKRIILNNATHGRLLAELYSQSRFMKISLTEKGLRSIHQ